MEKQLFLTVLIKFKFVEGRARITEKPGFFLKQSFRNPDFWAECGYLMILSMQFAVICCVPLNL